MTGLTFSEWGPEWTMLDAAIVSGKCGRSGRRVMGLMKDRQKKLGRSRMQTARMGQTARGPCGTAMGE